MDDSKIIAMLEDRDQTAIEELGRKYSPYLFAAAKNVLGDDGEAEECVNETLFRAWRRIPPAKPVNLKLFLGKIARETAIDTYRAKTADKRRGSEYEASLDELEEVVGPPDAEGEIDAALLRDAISRFLRGVTEEQRAIFIMRYFYFDPVKTIADSRGIGVANVKTTLFRMRAKLKEFLRKEGYTV